MKKIRPFESEIGINKIIENKIYLIRRQKVMFDSDLAELYGVNTKVLNQAVERNASRFPGDFAFQLTSGEAGILKSQFVTSRWGGRRKPIRVFTEQGVAMLSSVLRSEQAVQVNIAIMRAFVKLRQMLVNHKELAEKLEALERNYDAKFRLIFAAIKALMKPSPSMENQPQNPLGFEPNP